MRYLLDTNVLSEGLKPAPDARVAEWMNHNQDESGISVLALAEMARGAEALPDGKRKNELLRKVRFLQQDYSDAILPLDEVIAWEWARYCRRIAESGLQIAVVDSLMAATALAYGLAVVSRNTSDFPLVSVINPFEN
ncbi:MAG: type II toxin-antitoxin system VapC family toxin [Prosthecobacter sp.]|nr:type II toxin-antitoxin system VapC family toxin [Prosthecobacter sp.]